MHCPFCRNTDTRVLDSRVADDGGAIRRRRVCPSDNGGCGKRFSTVEQMQLTVVKRSGATEPFTRDKAISGVRKACKGRPVTEDQLACLGQQVEDFLRSEGYAEVPAHEVGLAILRPLRELDDWLAPYRWMWDAASDCSPPRSEKGWPSVMVAAHTRAAVDRWPGATPTTSSRGPAAERPASTTACCCADTTTWSSTAPHGPSTSTQTPANPSGPHHPNETSVTGSPTSPDNHDITSSPEVGQASPRIFARRVRSAGRRSWLARSST